MSGSIDPSVAAILDRHATSNDSDDEDALIAALEEEEEAAAVGGGGDEQHGVLASMREQRLQQLHSELARAKRMREDGTGVYTELKEEKAVMDITTSTKLAVVHFFKPDFGRCGVMDGHLEVLAAKHFDTRFLKINVENAPFLVTKLKVQVLPCVIAFVDGVGIDRIVGFEGLGRGDGFTTRDLETRLLTSGVLVRSKTTGDEQTSRWNQASAKEDDYDDDDDDWD